MKKLWQEIKSIATVAKRVYDFENIINITIAAVVSASISYYLYTKGPISIWMLFYMIFVGFMLTLLIMSMLYLVKAFFKNM